jgi:hypothetical protein|tara:strand:+ start:3421 stop:3603 length:183 start_codon:yes stop_codon:yes gene_type:complete
MNKTIRSVSLSNDIDNKLKEESKLRGTTISANVSRILYEYYQNNPIKDKNNLNIMPIKRK